MDIVRYYLAISVIIAHVSVLMGYNLWWPTTSHSAVGGFFALSGFLVYASYLKRPSLKSYVGARVRRILPSYSFIVLASALLLSAMSTLPPAQYFCSPDFWKYLGANLTFLNFLHPTLPGVFEGSEYAVPAVNGSLWTLKVEWMLYLSVPLVVALIGKIGDRYRQPVLWTILVLSILYALAMQLLYEASGREFYNILGRQFAGQLSYFYMGVILYFNRHWLTDRRLLSLAVIVALFLCREIVPYGYVTLSPIAVSASVLWVSLNGDWGRWLKHRDNISYDIYLFHFPVIQVAVGTGLSTQPAWVAVGAVCAVTALIAWAEWRFLGSKFARR